MIRVLIAEDMHILRESLKYMIESDTEMKVVGLAANGRDAFPLCCEQKPDIVLMDLKMPVYDGLEEIRLIKTAFTDIKVLVLTTLEDENSVSLAIQYGADGSIPRDLLPAQLQQSIRSVFLGPGIFKKSLVDSLAHKAENGPDSDGCNDIKKITAREKNLIRLIVAGKSYKEMGKEVALSEGYVRNMVAEILTKLKLKDRVQLAVFAVKHKII